MAKKFNKYKPSDVVAAGKPIIYYKNYRKITGSVTSAILFSQLEYWFSITGGWFFFKFLSRPESICSGYRDGDSWTEELGFSECEFRNAFRQIGVAYKSKTEFNKAEKAEKMFFGEDGVEKMYCSYYDKIERKTYYFRNQKLIEANLCKLRNSISGDLKS